MSAHRYLARLGARLGVALLVVALIGVVSAPVPAAAADLQAHITNLPSQYVLGAQGKSFTAVLESDRTDRAQGRLTWVIIIEMGGLSPGQVAVSRPFGGVLPMSGQDGLVRAVDQSGFFTPGVTARQSYRLRFALDAPTGKARVLFEVYGGDALLARSPSRSTSVRAGRGEVMRPTGTPLPGSNGTTFASQEPLGEAANPLASGADGPQVGGGGAIAVPFYVFGSLLVVGGGLLLVFLLRRNREELLSGADAVDLDDPGFAGRRSVDSPTMALPVVLDRPTVVGPPAPPQLPRRPRQHRME